MDRTPSADDLMASFLWRTAHHAGGTPGMGFGAPGHGGANAVVRTPSQNEMESYYNAMMASAVTGGSSGSLGQDNLIAHVGGGGPPSREGTPGIPRVASIDVLRKMIMSGGLPSGGAGGSGSPGSMTPTTAAAFSAFANGGANLSALGQLGVAAAAEAGADAAAPAKGGTKRGARKTAAKAPAAKKGKAAAKGAAAKGGAKGGGKAAESARAKAAKATEAPGASGEQNDSDADSRGGEDASDIRRQRRMLSNRESARRSRRRKLEHVATLEAQIAHLNNDLNAALQHLRTSEMRNAELTRENVTLRAEKERHLQLLRDAGQAGAGVTMPKSAPAMERKSSLQRISSNGDIKGELGKGSPTIGSGSSFVPFRSIQSYENLLALQAQSSGK